MQAAKFGHDFGKRTYVTAHWDSYATLKVMPCKPCASAADDRAAFSRRSFKFTLKMALRLLARSMRQAAMSEDCDWDRNQKPPWRLPAADAALAAGLYGRTQQMKGKL